MDEIFWGLLVTVGSSRGVVLPGENKTSKAYLMWDWYPISYDQSKPRFTPITQNSS